MRKYYCDRCGSQIDEDDVNHVIVLDYGKHNELDDLGDFCPNCMKLLYNVVRKEA